jgi:predicted DNA-binding transcriptional regulator YafY
VGKRSAIEATVGILGAFLRRRTWKQADLARELDLEPRALRGYLTELMRRNFPLEREEEPPQVYWSMSKDWFPGGLLLETVDVQLLLQLLCRMPASKARDKLMRRISSALPRQSNPVEHLESVLQGLGSEAPFIALVTDAAGRRSSLHFKYFSARRGALEWRHASVQRVLPGPPARMVAHCHRSGTLKWFRIDGIVDARLDPAVDYQQAAATDLDNYIATSLDGFASEAEPIEHRFFVAEPDARWVERNLIPPMTTEAVPGGLRVTCRTTAAVRLARFVLGLAPIARAESPELAALVTDLAASTLAHHDRAKALHGAVKIPAPGPSASAASSLPVAIRQKRGA